MCTQFLRMKVPDLLNKLSASCLGLKICDRNVILAVSVMSILDTKQVTTLLDVVAATEQNINLFHGNLLGLGDEEPDKEGEQEVDAGEHVEGVEAAVLQEGGKELLEDGVGDVLGLRGHTDGLSADVHGEDFGGPNPDGRSPGWLV